MQWLRPLLVALLLAACGPAAPERANQPAPPGAASGGTAGSQPQPSSPGTAQREVLRVQVGYPTVSISWLPIKLALDRGFFQEEALEVSLGRLASSVAIPALLSREVHFVTQTGSVLRSAVARDLPLQVLFISTIRPQHTLHVRDEIRVAADLRGKTLAVNSIGATQDLFTRRTLLGLGLQPDRDVGILAVGEDAARIAAMEQNIVQGTLLPPPANVQAQLQGFRVLAKVADFIEVPVAGLGAHRDMVAEQPELVRRMLRAAVRGLRYVHENREGTVQVIQDWADLEPAAAAFAYELAVPAYSHNGLFTDKSFDEDVQLGREEGVIPEGRAVDRNQVRNLAALRAVLQELGIPE